MNVMIIKCQEIEQRDGYFILRFAVSSNTSTEYIDGMIGSTIFGTVVDSYVREDGVTVITKLDTAYGVIEVGKSYDLTLNPV